MDIDKNSRVPLYYQISDILRDKIKSNLLKPGDPIPSETELMKESGISRGTVRQALQILTQEGIIERHPGRGSFVSYPKIEQDVTKVIGFLTEALLNAGRVPSAKLLEMKEFSAPELIKSKLQLSDNENIVLIKRVRYADDEPIAIESEYFIEEVGQKLLNEDLCGSLYKILQEKYGYYFYRSENTIETSLADSETASIFGIDKNSAIFVVHRILFLMDGNPFEYSEDLYRGDRIRFSIEDHYQKEKTEFKIKPKSYEDVKEEQI